MLPPSMQAWSVVIWVVGVLALSGVARIGWELGGVLWTLLT